MGKAMSVHRAAEIAEQLAHQMQVELVDTELVKEPTGMMLRFYVDRPEGITLNELETFHRALQPLVEEVAYDYMEVSSPGADRPLKTERDFERAAGMEVELKTYKPVNGGKQFTGILTDFRDGVITLTAPNGETLSFNKKDTAIVRPLIDFTEEDLQDG